MYDMNLQRKSEETQSFQRTDTVWIPVLTLLSSSVSETFNFEIKAVIGCFKIGPISTALSK